MNQTNTWSNRGQNVLMNTYNRSDKVMVSGKGTYLTDIDGKTYLDFISGIAVNSLGHANEKLNQAITDQGHELIHTSNLFWNTPSIEAAEKLTSLSGLGKVFFANSGAEANEGAIKLARKWGRETKGDDATTIISLKQSFHGRTIATLSATGQDSMHQDFAPNLVGFKYVTFNDSEELTKAVTQQTCAIIIEVIQGEGGVNTISEAFVETINTLQQNEDILVIIDEVQTGIGRTGSMFAFEQFALKPDIVTLAKGLGGGFPIGALLAKDSIANHFQPGDHGTTFGGNPLATACANVVLDTIHEEKLLDNVNLRHTQLVEGLGKIKDKHHSIIDIKGKGLLIGVQFKHAVDEIITECYQQQLLLISAKGNVVRFLPPLNVSEAEINEALKIFENVLVGIE
ncbi:aspartate aminotransferase family protein [Aerococcaceae bacterium DSM 111021]|nr:aspartate aminotransferase family protein [Aerococcaceae bacterium DSM 111021]